MSRGGVMGAVGGACLLAACGTGPAKSGADATIPRSSDSGAAGLAESGVLADAPADAPADAGAEAIADSGAPTDATTVPDSAADLDAGTVPPHAYRALAMTVGQEHACALLDNHRVKCWGFNRNGELGLGDGFRRGASPTEMGNALPFVDLGTGRTAKAIAAGGETTCAILDNGAVKCWGRGDLTGLVSTANKGDDPGEMGDALPTLDLGPARAVLVALSPTDACAVLDDGTARCWGADAPDRVPRPVALATTSRVTALAPSGPGFVVLFADGHVGGLLGQPIPAEWNHGVTAIGGFGAYIDVDGRNAGGTECAITTDGLAHCFQVDANQRLGATYAFSSVFSTASPIPRTLAIDFAGIITTCALIEGGAVQCVDQVPLDQPCTPDWCQLLPHTPDEPGAHYRVSFGHPAVALSSGGAGFSCALLSNGGVRCFGGEEPTLPNDSVGSSFDFMETNGEYSYGPFHDVDLGTGE